MERVSVAPTVEPITVEIAKAQIRELSGALTEDALIQGYIAAAREYAEMMTGRALLTQTVEAYFDNWHCWYALRKGPVQSISSVAYLSEATPTVYTALGATNYYTDLVGVPARVVMSTDVTLPTLAVRPNPIRITFLAGNTTATDVPHTIKLAMLLLVGAYYENRENIEMGTVKDPAQTAADVLLRNNRLYY